MISKSNQAPHGKPGTSIRCLCQCFTMLYPELRVIDRYRYRYIGSPGNDRSYFSSADVQSDARADQKIRFLQLFRGSHRRHIPDGRGTKAGATYDSILPLADGTDIKDGARFRRQRNGPLSTVLRRSAAGTGALPYQKSYASNSKFVR